MRRRALILTGMGAGALWALALPVLARGWTLQGVGWPHVVALAALPGGLVLLALIARLAQRRFFDDHLIDGAAPTPGTGAEIDQRVLTNTVEQLAQAACLWPFVGLVLGKGIILALGVSFGVTRALFWVGYHLSPPLRAFGFAAGFYPTISTLVLALIIGANLGVFAVH